MSKLVLTADQIFALAFILKAKYLDYYYISQANRNDSDKLWLSEITKQLVSQGTLTEDFTGDTFLNPDFETLIKPLYFGTKESSLDVNIFGENEDNKGYRFHFLDDRITMTRAIKDGFEITDISYDEMRKMVASILPAGYSAETSKAFIKFDVDKVSRVFVVKNTVVDEKNVIATFVETEGVVYEEDTDSTVYSVSGKDFEEKLYKILTEV